MIVVKMKRIGTTLFVGTGEAVPNPNELVDNEVVLAQLRAAGFDTGEKTGDSTEKLVGIRTRWMPPVERSSYDLALEAAHNAVAMAADRDPGFSVNKIRLIHSGGSTPDMIHPAIATRLQHALGVPVGDCEGRDIMLACTSGIDALTLADSRLRDIAVMEGITEPIYALISFGEAIATQANLPTNMDYTLWGCGAGAVVLRYDPSDDREVGILATKDICDGERAIYTESVGVGHRLDYHDKLPHATMGIYGKDIHRYAIREIPKFMRKFLEARDFETANPRSAFLPHNSNMSMQVHIAEALGFPVERMYTRIRERGNSSSASILITLDYFNRAGAFEADDRLFFAAFGGGMSMSFVDYRWD